MLGSQSGKSGKAGKSRIQVIRTRGLEVPGPQPSTTINSWGELEHIISEVQCHHLCERVGPDGGLVSQLWSAGQRNPAALAHSMVIWLGDVCDCFPTAEAETL